MRRRARRSSADRPYELASGPAAETFDSYSIRIRAEYAALLDGEPREPVLQAFFEKNPALVPSARSIGSVPGALPTRDLLISQPRLTGLRERRPDFMWLCLTSEACYPTLIEIERPTKALFNADHTPTAKFSQARHQITEWRAWFSRPENVQSFIHDYHLQSFSHMITRLQPVYVLLYGRRSEFEHNPELSSTRSHLLNSGDEFLVSYDRIAPDPSLRDAITVKLSTTGRFRAVALSPTLTLGPSDADRLLHIDNLERVIEGTESIAPERRAFLARRLAYWREWTKTRPRFVPVGAGTRE